MKIERLPFECINENLEFYTDSIGHDVPQLQEIRQLLEKQKQTQSSYSKELRNAVMHQINKEIELIQKHIRSISFQVSKHFNYPKGIYHTQHSIGNRASTKLCFDDVLPHTFVEHEAMSYECDMRISHHHHEDIYTNLSVCDNMLYLYPYDSIDRINNIRYLYIDSITTGRHKGKGYAKDLALIAARIAEQNTCDLIASHLYPDDKYSAQKIYSGKLKQGFIIQGSFCYKVFTPKGQSFIDGSFFD